jgi:hypothetical protein
MINVSRGDLVFNGPEEELHIGVRSALDEAAAAMLRAYDCESFDLAKVTTKVKPQLTFAKLVRNWTLPRSKVSFGKSYVVAALAACSGSWKIRLGAQAFYELALGEPDTEYRYKSSYSAFVRAGLAFFLVALHRARYITLPYSFTWPTLRDHRNRRLDVSTHVGSELMNLVRSVIQPEPAFADALEFVRTDKGRQTWFLLEGTKLLVALGWNEPADVSLEELLKFKEADDSTHFTKRTGMAYRALVHVLEKRYGERVAISVAAWDKALKAVERRAGATARLLGSRQSFEPLNAYSLRPSDAFPERLLRLKSLPGLDEDFRELASEWLMLEQLFIERLKRESVKEHRRSIGHWNSYLFFYLPYWFQQNPTTNLRFPRTPSALVRSVFVSRVVPLQGEAPLTYLQFLKEYGQHAEWSNNDVQYNSLKALEQFFGFLERHSSELPNCAGFKQPLSKEDFPPVPRASGTNKRPVPRRLFAFYVSYVEAVLSYTREVAAKIVSGEIAQDELDAFLPRRTVIDTFRCARLVGHVPVVFFKGAMHVLQFVPNCMDIDTFTLKDGRTLRIPQPHGLNNVLVAIYTGLRNNHIQWLDARTFDSEVHPDDVDCTRLWVNTDKAKISGWAPYVNYRVIQILRQQREWRDLIQSDAYEKLHFYMGNEKTKWPPILPLFASGSDGRPHPDSRYYSVWSRLLMGVQGMLRPLGLSGISLVRLLPVSVPLNAPDVARRLEGFRSSKEAYVALEPKSDITPHSARVGVVSNLIHDHPSEVRQVRKTNARRLKVVNKFANKVDAPLLLRNLPVFEWVSRSHSSGLEQQRLRRDKPAQMLVSTKHLHHTLI